MRVNAEIDGIENFEQAAISIAVSLKRIADGVELAVRTAQELRGLEGAERVAAYVVAVKDAVVQQDHGLAETIGAVQDIAENA